MKLEPEFLLHVADKYPPMWRVTVRLAVSKILEGEPLNEAEFTLVEEVLEKSVTKGGKRRRGRPPKAEKDWRSTTSRSIHKLQTGQVLSITETELVSRLLRKAVASKGASRRNVAPAQIEKQILLESYNFLKVAMRQRENDMREPTDKAVYQRIEENIQIWIKQKKWSPAKAYDRDTIRRYIARARRERHQAPSTVHDLIKSCAIEELLSGSEKE